MSKNLKWIIGILFLVILLLNVSSLINKTIVIDETAYIPQGYLILKKGLFFSDNAPPLIKMLSGFPLLFLDLNLPQNYYDLYINNEFMKFGANFLYDANNNAALITFLGRLLPMLLTLLLGFFVFKWAKELYGLEAGLFALILYTFSPNVLAESRLATMDLSIACFMFISIYFLWRYINDKKLKNLIFTAVFFGLSQITKLTAVFLLPIFVFLLYLSFLKEMPIGSTKDIKKILNRLTLKKFLRINYAIIFVVIIALIMINIAFFFHGSFTPLGENLRNDPAKYFDKNVFNSESISRSLPIDIPLVQKVSYFYLENVPVLLPYPYLKNFVGAMKSNRDDRMSGGFMNGKLYTRGENFFYYAENFLIRTPISLFILIILSMLFFKRTRSTKMDELFLLIMPIFVFIFFSIGRSWSGVRYLLALYPFLFVFVSKLTKIKGKRFFALICVLLGWFILSSLLVFPHYLTYFNELVGGPSQGYKYFVGPSFDIGQDLKLLGDYVKENNIHGIKLAYFGEGDPGYYVIDYNYLVYHGSLMDLNIENCEEQKGIIAVSITYLQPGKLLNNPYCLSWLKKYKSKQKIGNTIFVYEV